MLQTLQTSLICLCDLKSLCIAFDYSLTHSVLPSPWRTHLRLNRSFKRRERALIACSLSLPTQTLLLWRKIFETEAKRNYGDSMSEKKNFLSVLHAFTCRPARARSVVNASRRPSCRLLRATVLAREKHLLVFSSPQLPWLSSQPDLSPRS